MQTPAKRRDRIVQAAQAARLESASRGVSFGRPGETSAVPPHALYVTPSRRPLRIFAFDPMLGRVADNRITIDVPNEDPDLLPGPSGSQVQVVDYDGTSRCYYGAVDLNAPAVLMQDGLEPSESDPRFHQQMVYAVAMRVIENFERALGRKLRFRGERPLRLFPHAFHGANAYYDREQQALLFGYFRADERDPGPNLPGQTVYTCLSHDIIAHEMTHALVDQLREHFQEPSNPDVYAFHEGFADIVAIFQHFSFDGILRRYVQETRADISARTPLITLAEQFGFATGGGAALRQAREPTPPTGNPLYQTVYDPHERGAILVAAVFDAFFTVYRKRIADLVRIATGGSGVLPPGDLHPDLVNRMAGEATRTAQSILTMCIRAFEYLPPVDVTFGDYLRALVTADRDLVTTDALGQRQAMIDAFRARGIYPRHVVSLAEGSLVWDDCRSELPPLPAEVVSPEALRWGEFFDLADQGLDSERREKMAAGLTRYAEEHAPALQLDRGHPIKVQDFHNVFRVAPDGQLLVELVAQLTQEGQPPAGEDLGGLPLRGGTTLVAAEDGTVRYAIARPLPGAHLSGGASRVAEERQETLRALIQREDDGDPSLPWSVEGYRGQRALQRRGFPWIHNRALGRRRRSSGMGDGAP